MKKEIYTIQAWNVRDEYDVTSMSRLADYNSFDEAYAAAVEECSSFVGDEDVIQVTIFGGEYVDDKGNVFGEPFDLYTISNKDKSATAKAREEAGYTALNVDEYMS